MANARKELGDRLREAREYLGLSQQAVADHLKVSRSAISLIESGLRKVDTIELSKLARLYQRPVEDLTGPDTRLGKKRTPDEVAVLARTASELTKKDREEVLRFAEFLLAKAEREEK